MYCLEGCVLLKAPWEKVEEVVEVEEFAIDEAEESAFGQSGASLSNT